MQFSIYALLNELAAHGHAATYKDVKRSILILRRASLTITDSKTGKTWEENFFPQMAIGGWEGAAGAEYQQHYVSFHFLVSESIQTLQYRDVNYRDLMMIKGSLARYIFQRMASVYIYASSDDPYSPSRNQLLTESGRGTEGVGTRLSEQVSRALNQLVTQGIIERWSVKRREKTGRAVTNLFYEIFPTKRFISDIINANKSHTHRMKKLGQKRIAQIKGSIA